MNSGAVIIPARYESTRFPGKPLADIVGKPMIQHVYELCVQAVGGDRAFVATDNKNIKTVVEAFGGRVVMTSSSCLTGTDRIAEANDELGFDFVINVQGDEPLIKPSAIKKVFDMMQRDSSHVLNCYCKISPGEADSATVPKVVVSESGKLLYMSRGAVPFDKSGLGRSRFKQVCIYGFHRDHLRAFKAYQTKSTNEVFEDIEILRFLDLDFYVQMLEVEADSIAVDTPQDLERVVRVYEAKML